MFVVMALEDLLKTVAAGKMPWATESHGGLNTSNYRSWSNVGTGFPSM